MPLPNRDLLADVPVSEIEDALHGWRWKIGPDTRPLYVTAAGDVVLLDSDARVLLFDPGGGEVEPIAESKEEFERGLGDPEKVASWFSTSVVEQLRVSGVVLAPGQCYGYSTLPVFAEGSYGPENRFVLSAREHLIVTADLHQQLRDLPDGAPVRIQIVP